MRVGHFQDQPAVVGAGLQFDPQHVFGASDVPQVAILTSAPHACPDDSRQAGARKLEPLSRHLVEPRHGNPPNVPDRHHDLALQQPDGVPTEETDMEPVAGEA